MATGTVLKDGSTIFEQVEGAGGTCGYHKLHLKFLECGAPAGYVLKTVDGGKELLCEKHMRSIVGHLVRDEELPDKDDSWDAGDSLNLGLLAGLSPLETASVAETAEISKETPEDFQGGASGGAGADASFIEPEAAQPVETAAVSEEAAQSDSSPDSFDSSSSSPDSFDSSPSSHDSSSPDSSSSTDTTTVDA